MAVRNGFPAVMGCRTAAAVFLLVALCSPRLAQAACSGGRYSNTCSPGNFCDTDWWDTCESMSNCPAGTARQQYYQGSNQPPCVTCPANTYSNGNSYSVCTACPPNTYVAAGAGKSQGWCASRSPPPPSSPPPPPPSPSPPPSPPICLAAAAPTSGQTSCGTWPNDTCCARKMALYACNPGWGLQPTGEVYPTGPCRNAATQAFFRAQQAQAQASCQTCKVRGMDYCPYACTSSTSTLSNGQTCAQAISCAVASSPPPSPSPPPPPSPSPPPPTVYTSRKVRIGSQPYTDKPIGGPTVHVLNGGATTSSTETTADGKVLQYATTTTTDATQQGTGYGDIKAQSTSTTTSDVDHPQTFVKYNSPPPAVYTSAHVLHQTTGFGPKVTGGPTQHVLNGGATTTSTETTAIGKVMQFVTTTTTDATQQGTGNGRITAHSTESSTTATDHQQTFQKHNIHTTTTDLPVPDPSTLPAAPSVCDGKSFAVQSGAKSALCMHVKGGLGPDGFVVSSTVKRPIITMPCTPGSPNQQFTWVPTANGGVLVHKPSTMAVSLASGTAVSDGTGVLLAANNGAPSQEWVWNDAASGGTIASVANENFMITDSRVNADVSVGLPVHMWHLAKSLPSGAPNAQWYANCGV